MPKLVLVWLVALLSTVFALQGLSDLPVLGSLILSFCLFYLFFFSLLLHSNSVHSDATRLFYPQFCPHPLSVLLSSFSFRLFFPLATRHMIHKRHFLHVIRIWRVAAALCKTVLSCFFPLFSNMDNDDDIDHNLFCSLCFLFP